MGKGGFDPTTSPSKEACLTTTSQFNCDIFTNFNLYVQTISHVNCRGSNWVDPINQVGPKKEKKDACGRDAIGVKDRELGRTGENRRR
jgi:hypothetical protein